MNLIRIEDIQIAEDRQRQEFDPEALVELSTSIATNGLLHAVVLRDGGTLVAGERRIRAIRDMHFMNTPVRYGTEIVPAGFIPYNDIGVLSRLEALEAEYSENKHRRNLTWQEDAAATMQLHEIRRLGLAEAVAAGRAPEDASWDQSDTVQEIAGVRGVDYSGSRATTARKQLLVTENLAKVPEAAKAKTLDEAFKIVERAARMEDNLRRGVELANIPIASKHTLLQGSCLDLLPTMPGKFDVILSDPPYGMGADQFGDSGWGSGGKAHSYDDSYESWQSLMDSFIPRMSDAAKPAAHCYLFCDFDRFHELKRRLESEGWTVHRTPIILVKAGASGRVPWPKHGPRRQWELVLYAYRGGKMVQSLYPDICESPIITHRTDHPAEKSVPALINLLSRSCSPGDTVLDAFCGSGSIFPAAQAMSLLATGIELDPASYAMARTRLENLA